MKLYQIIYHDDESFKDELSEIAAQRDAIPDSTAFFNICSCSTDFSMLTHAASIIEDIFPGAPYIGASTYNNIVNAENVPESMTICCWLFEDARSYVHVGQLPLAETNEQGINAGSIITKEVNSLSYVRAVQLFTTLELSSMTELCDRLGALNPSIHLAGGAAFFPVINKPDARVISSAGTCADKSIVYAALCGPRLHVTSLFISGWKPLGRELQVTKSEGNIVHEFDGKPAFEAYRHYLHAENDESFANTIRAFPLAFQQDGVSITREPIFCTPEGSLVLTSDISNARTMRIAYGDPDAILRDAREAATIIRRFKPEGILAVSCASRHVFWGDQIARETRPFQEVAPTYGMYSASEFIRTGSSVYQNNVSLVILALREGKAADHIPYANQVGNDQIHMGSTPTLRLATFIQAVTDELEEANRKLDIMARMDTLTGLYNRGEIERRIEVAVGGQPAVGGFSPLDSGETSLIMLDVDNFKAINDTYGHKAGDTVLQHLGSTLRRFSRTYPLEGVAGRWGGEEFMVLLGNCNADAAARVAESIRQHFAGIEEPGMETQTVSLGVTQVRRGESADDVLRRVDDALYAAKAKGKNCVVVF
ncbi:sensor domain-containing diguanylate cyclase [Denitrobacterium detoxificans]|uniref:Diguanylate cyclase (GGDEF) domain-containing protein n=1 Tax=Denitrobacterium detoxificans TaxID=79604 RepID=A0A1H8S6H8_9ACTN|nr:diguanylate cyclase [Denitrobacterium detoxificans]SEO74147.1 diguanylate cyclase (GGDEF) domain-containing protein [Denitrobacterium detoxificans]